MIVIPDLFGSYQRGREEAIKNNWNDLAQYESIESSRHQNDAQALANLATMADFGKKRQMVSNEATNSDLTTELNKITQVGKVLNAEANNTLSLVNRNTINSNVPMLYDIAGANLGTAHNNAYTGYNNSGTNLLNSSALFTVTDKTYPEAVQALYDITRARHQVAGIQARVAPALAQSGADRDVINAKTSVKQAQQNYTVTDINGNYIGEQTHVANQVKLKNLYNGLIQGDIDKLTLQNTLNTLPAKQKQEVLSGLLQIATAANDPEAISKIYSMYSDVNQDLWKLVGGKGSIPIINFATGEVMGTANPDGTVSRASTGPANGNNKLTFNGQQYDTSTVQGKIGVLESQKAANTGPGSLQSLITRPIIRAVNTPSAYGVPVAKANQGYDATVYGVNWQMP